MAVLKYYNTATSAWEYIAASTTANFTTWKKTMAGGETSVSGTDDNAVTLSYTVGLEQVFINGVLQVRGSDYTATTGTSITGLSTLAVNDVVTVVCYAPFNVANTIAPTLVDAKGDLLAGTAADTVGRLAVGTNNYQLVADSAASTGLKWQQTQNIVQIVTASDTLTKDYTSSTYVDTGLSATITPTSSSNKILVFVNLAVGGRLNNNTAVKSKLLRGSTDIVQLSTFAYAFISTQPSFGYVSTVYLDSPATTSAVTYKTQAANNANQNYISTNEDLDGQATSTICLMEITV